MNNELTAAWPCIARACEVALVGGFAVNITYDTTAHPEMPNDFDVIKDYFSGVTFDKSGDITVMAHKPEPRVKFNGEKWSDVKKRAESVRVVELQMTSTSESFFKIIIEQMNMSVSKSNVTLKIANVLACMDCCKEIEPQHIAESFQYSGLGKDVYVCSVFSSLDKMRVKDCIDLLTDEQVKRVENYLHKLFKL
jgi:hypothetical protein